jgi:hypothetical protein
MSLRLYFPAKDPADQLDYEIDYSEWLTADDTLVSATLVHSPNGLLVDQPLVTDSTVRFWISEGVATKTYAVTCTAITAQGRTVERSVTLLVYQR